MKRKIIKELKRKYPKLKFMERIILSKYILNGMEYNKLLKELKKIDPNWKLITLYYDSSADYEERRIVDEKRNLEF